MKKKYGLLKVLAVLLLLVVVATYFINGRQGVIQYLALGDVFLNYIQSFYYFFDTAIFILVVGGFYGFLNRVPAYKRIVEGIANKVSAKNKNKLFIIVATLLFALLSSLTGLNVLLLVFVPFVVSIILLLGYDKLVALSATIGGILVGFVGGIFVTLKDASSYSSSYVTFEAMVGIEDQWANLVPKIILLVLSVALLIYTIVSHIKSVEKNGDKYQLTKSDNLFVEVKDRTGKKVKTDNKKKVMVWPVAMIMIFLLVLLVLGYFPWNSLFKISCFESFHTWLGELKIGDYVVFTNLISSSFTAFGTWADLGNYMMTIILMVVFMFLVMLIYRIKFEDAMDGFIYGVKKMIPAAMIAMLAYAVLVCSYNNGFVETIITNAGKEFGDNVVIHSLITMLGSILNVDTYYTTAGVFSSIVSSLTENANLSVYALMFQGLYGLVQLVGPTSLLLIVGLSYLEVPYKSWIKYIWRFIIELLIIILLALMLVSLL